MYNYQFSDFLTRNLTLFLALIMYFVSVPLIFTPSFCDFFCTCWKAFYDFLVFLATKCTSSACAKFCKVLLKIILPLFISISVMVFSKIVLNKSADKTPPCVETWLIINSQRVGLALTFTFKCILTYFRERYSLLFSRWRS